MLLYKRIFFIILSLLPVACILPGLIGGMSPASPGVSMAGPVLVQAPADATLTPTPFQPLPPTATYLPTAFPTPVPTATKVPKASKFVQKTWADYPGPSIWPDIQIPPPVGLLSQPAGQVNIMLLGSDQRPHDGGFRTDTIILLTLNLSKGTVNLTSFPRDLYVYIPGYTVQRINTAFQWGDFSSLADTMEYNFGVRPDHYVLINFWSFQQVIDQWDGINVEVAQSLTDHRSGYGNYTVPAGTVHMDGETALWYVRSRYSTSDFDRGRRQQEVVRALFKRLMKLDIIARAPKLYDTYRENVTTDLKLEDITPLLPLAVQVSDTSRIHHYFIGPYQVTPWVTTYGAQVLIPIREAVLEVMREALNSP